MEACLFRDIGFLITEYLEWKEVFLLLQTCRAAYKSFWTGRWQRTRSRFPVAHVLQRYINIIDNICHISWSDIQEETARKIGSLATNVKSVVVQESSLNGIRYFTGLSHAHVISVFSGCSELGFLSYLEQLVLENVRIDSFELLLNLNDLELLRISHVATDYLPSDWRPFACLQKLQSLEIISPRDVYVDASSLANLPNLKTLYLIFFSFKEFKFLKDIPSACELGLSCFDISSYTQAIETYTSHLDPSNVSLKELDSNLIEFLDV
jgi:hypothetical protein